MKIVPGLAGVCLRRYYASERCLKCRIGRVGNVQLVDSGSFFGSGFVVYDENGIPCVMFGYLSEGDAKAGHEHVEAALANVVSITGLR